MLLERTVRVDIVKTEHFGRIMIHACLCRVPHVNTSYVPLTLSESCAWFLFRL